jgi:hypothetical protein
MLECIPNEDRMVIQFQCGQSPVVDEAGERRVQSAQQSLFTFVEGRGEVWLACEQVDFGSRRRRSIPPGDFFCCFLVLFLFLPSGTSVASASVS